jgi:hypothetical protein
VHVLCAIQAWRQQTHDSGAAVPPVEDSDPDLHNDHFWSQFCLVDSVTLETEAGYTVCLNGLPTQQRRLSILEKACPDPNHDDFNVRPPACAQLTRVSPGAFKLLSAFWPSVRHVPPPHHQPLNGDEYTKYSNIVRKRSVEASEEASKDGPARAKFKRSRVGIPTVSQHLHLAPCLELGYADGAATYMADVVFAFSTRAAHDSAKRVRTARKHEVRDRPPVFLFVHWHEAAHVVGGDLALPFQVTFLGSEYSVIRADDCEQLRLRRAVKVVPQLDSFGGMVLPADPGLPGPGPQGPGLAGAARKTVRRNAYSNGALPPAMDHQPSVRLRRPPAGPSSALATTVIQRRYAMCYHPTLYVG